MQRLFSFIFILALELFAQNSSGFRLYSTDDGLSESTIEVIYQDKQGFMWIGTTHGLNKFDGYNFTIYRFNPDDTTSISDNFITDILEDTEGYLWIGTADGGLNRYDHDFNCFHRISHKKGESKNFSESVNCIAQDSKNQIWIGSRNGLELLNKKSDEFVQYRGWKDIEALIGPAEISRLLFDQQSILWIGTHDVGLIKLNIGTGEFFWFNTSNSTISHNRITDLSQDSKGRIWASTYGGGLNLIENNKISSVKSPTALSDNNLFCLYLDQEKYLLIGSEKSGLIRLKIDDFSTDTKTSLLKKFIDFPNSTSSNNIRAIFKDRQNNLWLGTYKGGLNFFPHFSKKFLHFKNEPFNPNSLSNNLVNTIFDDRDGHIWIGTDGGGLNYFDKYKNIFKSYKHSETNPKSLIHDHVLSICQESSGKLWLGTWGGLDLFDPKTEQFEHYAHQFASDSPSLNNIKHLYLDKRRKLWICTYYGLEIFDTKTREFFQVSTPMGGAGKLSNDWVLTVLEDANGNIWVGTRQGLNFLSASNINQNKYNFKYYLFQNYDQNDPRPKMIQALFMDSSSRIYAGTLDGLYLYDTKLDTFFLYSTKDGLPSNGICSILQDNAGFIWIGTLNGLSKFNPDTKEIENFEKSDGLQSEEFTGAVCKSISGELYFGGINGFNLFHPSEIIKNPFVATVAITHFQVHSKSVPIGFLKGGGSQIQLKPWHKVFTIEYAALDYSNPQKNQYAYKLEGFDKEWIYTNADRRFATYTGLKGGRYTFQVKATNADGLWNDHPTKLPITIIPPFWQSNWALIIYVGITLFILLSLRQIIVTKTRYDSELELDELKLNFFTNISHEFRTPLTLIIGPLEKLLSSEKQSNHLQIDKYHRLIHRNALRLLRLVNQIMDVQKIDKKRMQLELQHQDIVRFLDDITQSFSFLAETRHIDFSFHSDIKTLKINFDPEKMEKILFNLISNAFKFTDKGGKIELILTEMIAPNLNIIKHFKGDLDNFITKCKKNKCFKIVVQDTGTGIPLEKIDHIFELFYQGEHSHLTGTQGTGIGLALVKTFVEMHNGLISVDSHVGQGTKFTIVIPQDQSTIKSTNNELQKIEVNQELGADGYEKKSKSIKRKSPLILVVEDDADLALFICDHLQEKYNTVCARNGAEGASIAKETIPDLIISDVMMPEMDGFALCESLKSDEKTSHIPIILLTARASEAAQMKGIKIGADDYIKKPFKINMLIARIENIFENRKKIQHQFRKKISLLHNSKVNSTEDLFLKRLIRVLNENISDAKFDVEQMAQKIGMSRSQLYRKVSAIMDLTPNELIQSNRLEKAVQYLENDQLTCAEIAYRCGFSDPAYFSTTFKKKYRVPPTEFKKNKK